MMKALLLSMSLFALLACGTKKIAGDGTGQTIEMKTDKKGVATVGKAPMSSNNVNITSAGIDGNKLILEISYSGGCKDHTFELVGSEAIAKSLPPQRGVRLVRIGETDNCKALILKTLEFDIRNLAYKQEAGSEIILKLEGWDTDLRYVYE